MNKLTSLKRFESLMFMEIFILEVKKLKIPIVYEKVK
jgi:hypothetical protein